MLYKNWLCARKYNHFKYIIMDLQNCPVKDHICLNNVQISAEAVLHLLSLWTEV